MKKCNIMYGKEPQKTANIEPDDIVFHFELGSVCLIRPPPSGYLSYPNMGGGLAPVLPYMASRAS